MDFNLGFSIKYLGFNPFNVLKIRNLRAYGSGRAAFIDVILELQKSGHERILMPAWICNELPEAIMRATNIHISFYELTENFMPKFESENIRIGKDILVWVDYFGSMDSTVFSRIIDNYKCQIIFDAVHSWCSEKTKLPSHVTIISGFRKIFFKGVGAFVSGTIASNLPLRPAFIAAASPGFPKNLTLSTRFGVLWAVVCIFFSQKRLRLALDQAIGHGPNPSNRSQLRNDGPACFLSCPAQLVDYNSLVKLVPSEQKPSFWDWPDLPETLHGRTAENAQLFRKTYKVVLRSNIER